MTTEWSLNKNVSLLLRCWKPLYELYIPHLHVHVLQNWGSMLCDSHCQWSTYIRYTRIGGQVIDLVRGKPVQTSSCNRNATYNSDVVCKLFENKLTDADWRPFPCMDGSLCKHTSPYNANTIISCRTRRFHNYPLLYAKVRILTAIDVIDVFINNIQNICILQLVQSWLA